MTSTLRDRFSEKFDPGFNAYSSGKEETVLRNCAPEDVLAFIESECQEARKEERESFREKLRKMRSEEWGSLEADEAVNAATEDLELSLSPTEN